MNETMQNKIHNLIWFFVWWFMGALLIGNVYFLLSPKNHHYFQRKISYHEAGHAVIGLLHDDVFKVHKATIAPSLEPFTQIGGYVSFGDAHGKEVDEEKEFISQIMMDLSGCVAEELIFPCVSPKSFTFWLESDCKNAKYQYNSRHNCNDVYSVDKWKYNFEPYWLKTKEYLKEHEILLHTIALELLEKKTLSQERLYQLKDDYLKLIKNQKRIEK